jgi:hypothetical protein
MAKALIGGVCLALGIDDIRWHHRPYLSEADGEIVSAVHVADVLAHRFGIGESGNFRAPDVDAASWSRFDLSEKRLASIRVLVEGDVH